MFILSYFEFKEKIDISQYSQYTKYKSNKTQGTKYNSKRKRMEVSVTTVDNTSEMTNASIDSATAENTFNTEMNAKIDEDNHQTSGNIIRSVEERVERAIETELSTDNDNDNGEVTNNQDKKLEQRVEQYMVNHVERGFVKWFNNKVGYGFITVRHVKEGFTYDIFVHHSAIQVKTEQYRYLVQGEYVQFKWSLTNNEQYKWHAISISGIDGGPLMCETRNELRAQDDKRTRRERGTGTESHGRSSSYIVGATNNRFARNNSNTSDSRVSGRQQHMKQNSSASSGVPIDSDGFQLVERRH